MTRHCGNCTLCCKLLPVRELGKAAGHRCAHQRMGKGCVIYKSRPMSCVLWDCVWLSGDADLRRPDFSHYVVDPAPDYVTALPEDGGDKITIPVVQVWVDPKFPDAHRDPALRAYLERRAREDGFAAIIRYSSERGFVLFPPSMTGRGWIENEGTSVGGPQHSQAEIAQKLTAATGEDYVEGYLRSAVDRLERL